MIFPRRTSAYLEFCRIHRSAIHQQHPELTPAEITKELGRRWQEEKRERSCQTLITRFITLLLLSGIGWIGWNLPSPSPSSPPLPSYSPPSLPFRPSLSYVPFPPTNRSVFSLPMGGGSNVNGKKEKGEEKVEEKGKKGANDGKKGEEKEEKDNTPYGLWSISGFFLTIFIGLLS